MKKLLGYFLQGLLITAPLGLTLYMIYVVFNYIDQLVRQHIEEWLNFHIPGLGLVLIFVLITLLGMVGQSVIFRPIRWLVRITLEKAPVLNLIYTSIRDFLNAFVGKDRKFNQPVLVKVNTVSELEKIGFLTQEDLTDLGIKDKVAVYFPHSYNFSGEMFIVPAEHVKPLNMSSSDAMKFVVSGGVARN
jgi:uncharacterized membrane protein